MANWSRRRTKTFKGTGARSTTTVTFGKGVTRSSSTKLGTKRTTRSTAPNGKTKIIETYNINGATKRSVTTLGKSNLKNVDNLFKLPKLKKTKNSGSWSSGSNYSSNTSDDTNIFFWPIVGMIILTLLFFW